MCKRRQTKKIKLCDLNIGDELLINDNFIRVKDILYLTGASDYAIGTEESYFFLDANKEVLIKNV